MSNTIQYITGFKKQLTCEPFYSQCLFITYSDNWCNVWSPWSAQKHLQFH